MKQKSNFIYLLFAELGIALLVTVGTLTYKEAALKIRELKNHR